MSRQRLSSNSNSSRVVKRCVSATSSPSREPTSQFPVPSPSFLLVPILSHNRLGVTGVDMSKGICAYHTLVVDNNKRLESATAGGGKES